MQLQNSQGLGREVGGGAGILTVCGMGEAGR